MQHRTRDVLIRQRTQIINALRAHLAELLRWRRPGDWASRRPTLRWWDRVSPETAIRSSRQQRAARWGAHRARRMGQVAAMKTCQA
jgi:hypothetical protein